MTGSRQSGTGVWYCSVCGYVDTEGSKDVKCSRGHRPHFYTEVVRGDRLLISRLPGVQGKPHDDDDDQTLRAVLAAAQAYERARRDAS